MNRKSVSVSVVILSALLLMVGSGVQAAEQGQGREPAQMPDQEIYGYQLMTPQERDEYRTRMHAATTWEEREQIRQEHHDQMLERAKERGMTLPPESPRGGMGPGMGPGRRMGPGTGMGPGGGGGPGRGPRY